MNGVGRMCGLMCKARLAKTETGGVSRRNDSGKGEEMRLKLLAIAFTATLAMTLGLTACSSQQASDLESTEAASDVAVSGESAAAAPEAVLYWAGTLSDGRVVHNMFDATGENAVLSIANPDGSEAEVFSGKMTMTEDGKVTIVGVTDEDAATLSVVGIADDLSALKIDIEGYGEADMKPVTEAEFTTETEQIMADRIFYWEGALPDGRIVYNMFDDVSENAIICIVKPDGTQEEYHEGKVAIDGDKVSVTGGVPMETITYTYVNRADDASSLKIDMEGYGEVDLKPIDEAGFIAAIGDNATGNAHYWKGALPDGQVVANMLDTTGDYAVLSITNPDGSEGKYYAGKVMIAGDRFVIIDDESKQSVSYAVVGTDNNGLKIDIAGYGEAELELIDEAEFTELTTK